MRKKTWLWQKQNLTCDYEEKTWHEQGQTIDNMNDGEDLAKKHGKPGN